MSDLRKKLMQRDEKALRLQKGSGKLPTPKDGINPSKRKSENFRKKLKGRSQ
jgi:hypothetical protein